MTHMKNSGEWIDGAREVHLKVQEATSDILQDINEDVDEDQIINEAFQSIVGKRIGYCRGLGVGIKPTRGKSSALNQELASERKKRHDIKIKLKERLKLNFKKSVAKDKKWKHNSKRPKDSLNNRMEKQLEEKLAHIFFRRNPFTAGQFSSVRNNAAYHDHRVESTGNIWAQREIMEASTTLRREGQDKVRRFN
ncbi:uncharacterized protein LOC123910069 [Trifolium pratense]|uniref:uncharacterized protein LOC123910069 n=1 Tax=Trifolium pratense TaxID=57577 RepID=UPI001E6919EE|nr:uncharacterized protein LOC123910069 [Trifolium pratense]XP_045817072.1 uncharacterized protein LOC123910069 [Trifolium pratense]